MDHPKEISEREQAIDSSAGLHMVLEKDEIRMLETLELNSFEHLQYAFEDIVNNAPLYEGTSSFQQAAIALDMAAKLFPAIDHDGDHMLSPSELESYLAQCNMANKEALSWLVSHYDAFSKACFFEGTVTRDDIEEARNVFHGLHHLHDQFGFEGAPSPETLAALSPAGILAYLEQHKAHLDSHEIAGLKGLAEHIASLKKHDDDD